MTKRDLIIFIFKWSYGLLGYWFFIIGLSVLLVYTLPQKFEATAKILIESNRAPVMRADVAFGVEQLNVLNSEVAIIRSNPVFQATADRIEAINKRKQANAENAAEADDSGLVAGLLELVDRFMGWMIDVGLREQSSPREKLIQGLESRLKIAPQANSNVIAISYTSDDPKMAATIVNTITEKYIDHHLKIYSSLGISEVYRLQIERMENDLKSRRDELADYKRVNAVTALNETKRAQVQRQTQLSAEQRGIEQQLAELLTRFGQGHTRVQLTEERLQTVQRSLDEITRKLQELEVVESVIRNMEIEINSIELSTQSYKKLFQDEQLVNLANPDVVNVLIIEEAVAPTRPTHSRLYYIVLATIGGFMISVAIAIIREYFDRRVTDPRVAAQLLGVPTLGSIEKA